MKVFFFQHTSLYEAGWVNGIEGTIVRHFVEAHNLVPEYIVRTYLNYKQSYFYLKLKETYLLIVRMNCDNKSIRTV